MGRLFDVNVWDDTKRLSGNPGAVQIRLDSEDFAMPQYVYGILFSEVLILGY
jgi:hypothetical protein